MRTRVLVTAFVFLASCALVGASDSGRYMGIPKPGAIPQPVQTGSVGRPDDFGPAGDTVSTFIPESFRPLDSGTTFTTAFGQMWPTIPVTPTAPGGVTGPVFAANLQVPEGAVIDYLVFQICNDNATSAPLLFGGGQSGISGDFMVFGTAVTSGCTRATSPLINYQVGANAATSFYLFINWEGALRDGSVRWGDAQVWWHRSVSPAPGSPTFGDVPPSDPAFQFIEALVASGITAGCGGGNYCPDAPLTRRQMAVFLAKALGLYWSNLP